MRMTCQVGPVKSGSIQSREESDTIGQTFAIVVDSGGQKGKLSSDYPASYWVCSRVKCPECLVSISLLIRHF